MSEKTIAEKLTEIAENIPIIRQKAYANGYEAGAKTVTGGYELIDDVTLSEDVNDVAFTQSKSGVPVNEYADFFVLFLGKFTASETSAVYIRANDGVWYYMYTGFAKSASSTRAFWAEINELAVGKFDGDLRQRVWKTTYPKQLLFNFLTPPKISAQGLAENNRDVVSDITISDIDPAQNEGLIEKLRLGAAGAGFAAGSRVLLLGRRRKNI